MTVANQPEGTTGHRVLQPQDKAALLEALAASVDVLIGDEVFRPIAGFPRYAIGNRGAVFSGVRSCRYLKPTISTNGYPYVSLMSSVGPVRHFVHRLVAEHFVEKAGQDLIVNHIDGNKLNAEFSNLEWTTYSANNDHARKNGLSMAFGQTHYSAKLTEESIRDIRERFERGEMQKQIANDYGIGQPAVSKIVTRKTWGMLG